jgi:ABC-type amino acid transport substrate-binding protein
MKKIIALFFIAFCTSSVFGQQEPVYENEVLTTSTGFKIKAGDKLKVGVGSANDGAFNFIRVSSNSLMYTYSPNGLNTRGAAANNALPASYSGLYVEVAKINKRGSTKRGFVYYPIVKVGGMARYEVDIENAIAKEEIVIPEEFRPKAKKELNQGEVKSEISIADELSKLKKLFDDGVLTEEEYKNQKKKLLGN